MLKVVGLIYWLSFSYKFPFLSVELDYMEVFELLFFGIELDSRQCLDIIIFDDSTFEGDENFILTLQAENVDALTMNTSIIILDDDGTYMMCMLSVIVYLPVIYVHSWEFWRVISFWRKCRRHQSSDSFQ